MKKHIEMYQCDKNNTKYIIKCAFICIISEILISSLISATYFKSKKNILQTK